MSPAHQQAIEHQAARMPCCSSTRGSVLSHHLVLCCSRILQQLLSSATAALCWVNLLLTACSTLCCPPVRLQKGQPVGRSLMWLRCKWMTSSSCLPSSHHEARLQSFSSTSNR